MSGLGRMWSEIRHCPEFARGVWRPCSFGQCPALHGCGRTTDIVQNPARPGEGRTWAGRDAPTAQSFPYVAA